MKNNHLHFVFLILLGFGFSSTEGSATSIGAIIIPVPANETGRRVDDDGSSHQWTNSFGIESVFHLGTRYASITFEAFHTSISHYPNGSESSSSGTGVFEDSHFLSRALFDLKTGEILADLPDYLIPVTLDQQTEQLVVIQFEGRPDPMQPELSKLFMIRHLLPLPLPPNLNHQDLQKITRQEIVIGRNGLCFIERSQPALLFQNAKLDFQQIDLATGHLSTLAKFDKPIDLSQCRAVDQSILVFNSDYRADNFEIFKIESGAVSKQVFPLKEQDDTMIVGSKFFVNITEKNELFKVHRSPLVTSQLPFQTKSFYLSPSIHRSYSVKPFGNYPFLNIRGWKKENGNQFANLASVLSGKSVSIKLDSPSCTGQEILVTDNEGSLFVILDKQKKHMLVDLNTLLKCKTKDSTEKKPSVKLLGSSLLDYLYLAQVYQQAKPSLISEFKNRYLLTDEEKANVLKLVSELGHSSYHARKRASRQLTQLKDLAVWRYFIKYFKENMEHLSLEQKSSLRHMDLLNSEDLSFDLTALYLIADKDPNPLDILNEIIAIEDLPLETRRIATGLRNSFIE